MGIKLFSAGLIVSGCLPIASYAEPFTVRDLNPLLSGFEFSTPLSGTNARQNIVDLSYAISNITLDQQPGNEHLIADAELRRWQLTTSHPLGPNWTIQIDLPYQSISGGSLDTFIEHFHSTFNLPNGNRASWPHNRLLVDYSVADQSLFHLTNAHAGIGDTAIHAGWRFASSTSQSAMLWFTAKMPTGNAKSLTGSGTTDATISLAAQQHLSNDINFFEQLTLSWLGNGARLSDEQKHSVWSCMTGLSWSLTHSIDTTFQLNSHSAIYASNVRMLGNATQFTIGPRYHSAQWQAWLAITEDIVVDTAPDVQFQFSVSHSF